MGHSERVGKYSMSVAEFLGLPAGTVSEIYIAGLLHDIGRLGQHDDIIEAQRQINRGDEKPIIAHVELGAALLKDVGALESIVPIVESHHEFCDGSGLPKHLKGDEIPLGGRIVAAANVLDEMLHPIIPEIKPLPLSEALKKLRLLAGTKLDEKVVDAFLVAYRKGALLPDFQDREG